MTRALIITGLAFLILFGLWLFVRDGGPPNEGD